MASALKKRIKTEPSADFKMAPLERAGDGFCSWEEEEDMDTDMHSPTDVSEDSVDVKVKPILGLAGSCNKRKCAEPVKFGEEVKRLLVDDIRTRSDTESSPFRPWSETPSGYVPRGCPVPGDQDEPLSLVLRDKPSPKTRECQPAPHAKSRPRPLLLPEPTSAVPLQRLSNESHAKSRPRPSVLAEPSLHRLSAESHVRPTPRPAATELSPVRPTPRPAATELSPVRLTPRPAATELSPVRLSAESHAKCRPRPHEVTRLRQSPGKTVTVNVKPEHSVAGRAQEVDSCGKLRTFSVESLMSERPGNSSSTSSMTDGQRRQNGFQQQRNYKNMTRERRVEANARERTRVHTISAAFDSLRRAVPAYSHNQKLSKLSVLRIACAYILTLSRVAGEDYSADNSRPALGDCVDHVTRTIQLEGKLRKKKDD